MDFNITKIQSAVGICGFIIVVFILALAASWGITCLLTYWISILWADNIPILWSWEFGTGCWLSLLLLAIPRSSIHFNFKG